MIPRRQDQIGGPGAPGPRPGPPYSQEGTHSPPQVLDLGRDALKLVAAEAEGLQRAQLQQRGGHLLEAVPAEVKHLEAAAERRLGQALGEGTRPLSQIIFNCHPVKKIKC